MTLLTLYAAIPVQALLVKGLFAGSPNYYTDPGSDMRVGQVEIWNDADYLYIRYRITMVGWELTETHVAVAMSLDDIPQTKSGNPKVGQFPYKMEHNPAVTLYTYMIDLDSEWVKGTTLCVAAHAVVQNDGQEETAWVNCQGPKFVFPGSSWASYITYDVESIA